MPSVGPMLETMRARWASYSVRTRIALAFAAAAAVGAGLFAYSRATQPTFATLYSELSQEDAAAVVEKLRDTHVLYEIADDGSTIRVPDDKVHETRLALASAGLPRGGGVGFEIFDEQRFGESEFSEQVKYHRALEGELSRTITHLGGVENARVHLVLPTRSLFASNESQASASVALKLTPGSRLRDDQVRGIVHLVASSVRGLEPASVTIVDGDGRKLAGGDEADEEVASTALEFRHELEHGTERSVQQLLDAMLGEGKSMVRIAADVTFAREERTEERFDPQSTAPRSFQITEERDVGATTTTAGVPGAASNLPGGEAATGGESATGLVRRSETRNFEISKVVRHAVEPVGRVSRLNVAVVVDGHWTAGARGRRTFHPRGAGELARIKSLVESAVGIQSERGDRVTVECLPFGGSRDLAARSGGRAAHARAKGIEALMPYAPYAAGAVVLLLVLVMGMLSARRRARGPVGAKVTALPAPGSLNALEPGTAVRELGAPSSAEGVDGKRSPAAELAMQDPELAARIVRGWLLEGRP